MEEEKKTKDLHATPETSEVSESKPEVEVVASKVSETSNDTLAKLKNNKLWLAVIIILGSVFAAGLVFYLNTNDLDGTAGLVSRDADYVLATVNGDEIYQKDLDARLQEVSQEFLAQGIDMSDEAVRVEIETQLLDDIIGYKLLVQASTDAEIEVSAEEVDGLLQGYIEQAGGEELLDAELAKIDLTRDIFRQRLTEQLTLQQYISDNVEESVVSDEDIAAFYESVVAGQEGAPPLVEIRDQIEAQLSSDAQQQDVVTFVTSLRESADIVVN